MRAPSRGTEVMLRTLGTSPVGVATSWTRSTSRSTATPSICAKPAPMQRRTPPPNGIQVLVGGFWPRNRSGRKTSGSGWFSDFWWATMIEGPTVTPRGRSTPPMVAGRIRVRTTIGITGCRRIDSFITASSQASSSTLSPSAAACERRSSSGSRPSS